MSGEAQGVVEDLLLDFGSHAVGMRIARATTLFHKRGNAADLKGTLDFVEGVAVIAHEPAGLGDVAELLGELQQGQFSLGTLRERSHLGTPDSWWFGDYQSIPETRVAAPQTPALRSGVRSMPTVGKIREQLKMRMPIGHGSRNLSGVLPRSNRGKRRRSPATMSYGRRARALEHISKPALKDSQTDQSAAECEQGQMHFAETLVADRQAAVAGEPSEGALDHPAIAPQPLAGVDLAPRDTRNDAAQPTGTAAAAMIIGFVGVQLCRAVPRSATPPAANRGNGIEQALERQMIVEIRCTHISNERNAAPLDHQVLLRARAALVGGVRPGVLAPLLAGSDLESSTTRLQLSRPERSSRSSSLRCSRSHTPRRCHSRKRRQHVTPEPHPSSGGSADHGAPVARMNRMPRKASRSATRGRPPLRLRRRLGSSGSTSAHNSSLTSALMPARQQAAYLGF